MQSNKRRGGKVIDQEEKTKSKRISVEATSKKLDPLPINEAIKQKWVYIIVTYKLYSRNRIFIQIFQEAYNLQKVDIMSS